jgi:DNA polymerase-3 subunit gamma/tau
VARRDREIRAVADPGTTLADTGTGRSAAVPSEPGVTGRAPAATGPAGTDLLREIETRWADIRTKVRESGAAVHAMLSGATVARVDGDTVVLTHQSPALVQRLAQPQYVEAVRSAIQAVLGGAHEVRWETGAAQSGPGGDSGGGRASGSGRESGTSGRSGGGRGSGGTQAKQPGQSEAPRFTRRSQTRAAQSGAPDSDETAGTRTAVSQTSTPRSAPGPATAPPDDSFPPPDDSIPLPDGPDYPDDPGPIDDASEYSPVGYDGVPPAPTPEEEQEMLAESARPMPAGDRRDPDEVALELLRSELGATRIQS